MKKLICTPIFIALNLLISNNGYSQTTQYSDFEPTVFEGSTVVDNVYSPGLEGNLLGDPSTQPVKVYLPTGYDLYSKNRYPVLYLLNAYTEDYDTYYESNIKLLQKLDYMIAKRTIMPMIVVTPNGKNQYDGCMYANSFVIGNWEDYIVQDVVQNVESKYQVLRHRDARGLYGYSMGGVGTISIAMKHPSVYGSIAMTNTAWLDFEVAHNNGSHSFKKHIISAAEAGDYRFGHRWEVRWCFAQAAAYSPDSTAKSLCSLPYDAGGVRIDSIWQKWLKHDPLTLLPTFKDSLLKLNSIQIYVGDADFTFPDNDSYHKALGDQGIEHGYRIFSGGHDHGPVINEMLIYFSEQLIGTVPIIRSSSDFYLETTDSLMAETNMDGKLYIVPASAGYGPDSIYKYQVASKDALANQENEFQLSGFEFGKYQVFAVSNDSAVSNIPEEFCVVPDTSRPILNLVSDSVNLGDSIRVSLSRDGRICIVTSSWIPVTFNTVSEIMNSSRLIGCIDALAETTVNIGTDDLSTKSYLIYGYDQYGIVTGPISVDIVTSTEQVTRNTLEVMVFPNPANDLLNIETIQPGRNFIEITSLNGQLLYTDSMEGPTHQIDLSSFQKGLYLITIRSREYVRTEKIIKQ